MLYPRWLETSQRHAMLPAIYEEARVWSFGDLAHAVAHTPRAERQVIARTGSAEFVVKILSAWRDGQAVIPLERDAPEPQLHSPPPEGCALVKYTPGATGVPRGIFFNDAALIADCDRLVDAMRLVPSIPNLAVVSLSHSYGFSNIVLPLILHGIPIHLVALPFPRVVESVFQQHASLVVPAVPSMWRAWHRAGILKQAPIALAISAGAPLALELERDVYESAHLKIHNFYGASECGGISFDASDTPRNSADDVGTVLPGVVVEKNREGRLCVKSDSVATGYDVARLGDGLSSGEYLTRDFGSVETDGRVHLTGTCSGAINVAGRKISPSKVEAALLETGLVANAHVFGVPSVDPERCEEISARVTLKQGKTIEELKNAALSKLQNWELPRHWSAGDHI